MMNPIRSIKGTYDILPEDIFLWHSLESIIFEICSQYGFKEIRTPVFEETRLFSRAVGENTDIVTREMYTWNDKDNRSLTLRPELTASVARSFIQHNLDKDSPIQRLFYIGPIFRRERPQKGRQRQFHQFGIEAFGSDKPEQDVEIIALAWHFLSKCKLTENGNLNINSIGSKKCRDAYCSALKDYINPFLSELSITSKSRFEKNPLRVLDTKLDKELTLLQDAPVITDFYTSQDIKHFESVQNFLSQLKIPFTVNPKLVRGLDYYGGTVFEFNSNSIGAQDALLGGGRYDGLIEMIGGKSTPGIGFAAGMERLLLAMNFRDDYPDNNKPDIYFVCLGDESVAMALNISMQLRFKGFKVIFNSLNRSMKSQLRAANKSGSKYALIIGEDEVKSGSVCFKSLKSGEQNKILQSEIINFLDTLTR